MDNSYRIKANVGIDQVLNVNLKQDIDIYEVLSLKLKQENLYKLHSADYGVIVGRVLANDAFGVPNAKVTVFIPLSDVDKLRQGIRDIYPYNFVTDVDNRKVKFNALPNYQKFDCHQEVGSFPKKQLVLDDDSVLEVYDKYYKYTTITNKAGDYMIFGVPTGEQVLHVDVDLSDIGIISQEPRDFIYKGYSIDLFESPTQFKKGTNLDDLPQIQNQTASVTVYPLWGDKNTNEIAITRKDINLQYKFETTCVFIGSVITDNGSSSIAHNCIPDESVGEASQLSPSKGNIEMIRKTIDDKVEEYPIKGNQLIDGDGTWCYQIPMNLDYVGMDEYGNIVPTNNPLKGIPTRARVRFRFTLDETGEDDLTRHKARYLVPNNPDMYEGHLEPHMYDEVMDKDLYYEFGTLTPEDCFRDLYWNKVYSVKNYIPRLQMSKHEKSSNYLAIKGVNKKDATKYNPIPYNKINLNFSIPAYYMMYKYAIGIKGITGFWRYLRSYSIPYSTDNVREKILEELDGIGLDFYNDWLNGCLYFPSWFWHIRQKKKQKKGESLYDSSFCECKNKDDDNIQGGLYLYNNCSLVYENDDLVIKTYNPVTKDYLYKPFNQMYTGIPFGTKQFFSGIIKKKTNKNGADAFYYSFGNKLANKKVAGNPSFNNQFPDEIRPEDGEHYYKYARLFSTDIVLLGSLKDCDLDGVPKIGYTIPSTTSNIPPMGRYKPQSEEVDDEASKQEPSYEAEDNEANLFSHNGMNWGAHWHTQLGWVAQIVYDVLQQFGVPSPYKYHLGSGLFFGLSSHKVYEGTDWATHGLLLSLGVLGEMVGESYNNTRPLKRVDIVPRSDLKTCMNLERISELGVTLDSEVNIEYEEIDGSTGYSFVSEMDGLITKREIEDNESRSLFATLNYNKLLGTVENFITGYKKYDLKYFYPTNFDGRMGDAIQLVNRSNGKFGEVTSAIAEYYTSSEVNPTGVTSDDRNHDYLDFKFGNRKGGYNNSYRSLSIGYDGKQSYIPTFGANSSGQKAKNVINGNYNEYETYDGFAKFTRFTKPKNRHFYGYNNSQDTVYPLGRNRVLFSDYPYTFPLYDNSFYFYFGLNQGSTAIDKFYEQFYSECPSMKKMPFMMEVTVTAATACGLNDGVIRTNVQEINFPYVIQLWEGDTLKDEKRDVYVYLTEFKNLPNGEYKVVVNDLYGTRLEEKVVLKYQKISLDTEVVRGIQTEYIGQTCDEICDHDYYGKLSINTYTIYGEQQNVSLSKVSDGIYNLGTYNGNIIRMEIKPNNADKTFNDFVCGGCSTIPELSGNIININAPGTFTVKVYEMCGNEISENVSYYTITIPDLKRLEMYINEVPLKYMVGYEEDIIEKYNIPFHGDGHQVMDVHDATIMGWFGTHNPESYSKLFKKPLETQVTKLLWIVDIGDSGNYDILREKFRFMFNLSKGAYVTAGATNKFEVEVDGGDGGEILLRSGMPEYDKFSEYNTERAGQFNSYLTNERNIALCNEFNPNIVSENYRYVLDNNKRFPVACDGTVGEQPILEPGCHSGYEFNPKYADRINKAANYFAGFSNNADIVQDKPDDCIQRNDYKPYQVIPYKAADLYNQGMCIYSEKPTILEPVYKPTTDDKGEHKRYVRTEFIDRRFDYNAFFITGHRGIHYDISDYEEKIINNSTIWDKGRISALTYNGIEMLYQENNGDKLIISESGPTEYNYTADTAEVKLDLDNHKRFYDSKLYYDNNAGKFVNLLWAFDYINNSGPRAFYLDTEGSEVDCAHNTNPMPAPEFKNFGYNGSSVDGYPSKRWVDYYRLPYGDFYHFHNVSCGYDGIEIEQTDKLIKAIAVPGEVVDFNIEACELITMLCYDFESDSKAGHFNIMYTGAAGGTCTSVNIVDLPFRIDTSGSTGFRTKVEKLNIRVCWDDAAHSNLIAIKSAPTFDACTGKVDSTTVKTITPPNIFDTEETFKNTNFNGNIGWAPPYQFINMIFDRMYYSQAADSLMKRIRVLNTSTIYNVSDFGFAYTDHKIVSDEFVIPKEEIKVDVEADGTGTVTADTPSNSGEEGGEGGEGGGTTGGDGDEPSGGGTVDVHSTGTGTGSQDAHGKKWHDYTEFTFTSKFIANCMSRFCVKIKFEGMTAFYTLYENSAGIILRDKDAGIVKIGVIWSQHKVLLKDATQGPAEVTIYLDIENEIKGKENKAHMEFAFAFSMDESHIIADLTPDTSGMNVIDDTPSSGGGGDEGGNTGGNQNGGENGS